jgi:hypothetical protein
LTADENKKRLRTVVSQPLQDYSPACAVNAGIPNLTAQGGHSQPNFGFVKQVTITPTKLIPQPMRLNGSRNIWQISNTAG